MERIEKFVNDLKYVIEIYDDIVKTYKDNLNSSSDVSICDIYNKDDLHKFIIINKLCNHAVNRKSTKNIDYIDIPDLIDTYEHNNKIYFNDDEISVILDFYICYKSIYKIYIDSSFREKIKMVESEFDSLYKKIYNYNN